jgi:hypothetical protein
VATTDRVFTLVTRRGALARRVRTRLVPRIAPLLFRLPAFRQLLFRTVSQTGISYHRSSLSVGRAGDVRAGDRLPWVRLTRGHDNFAPLASPEWHAHVYGAPPRGVAEACRDLALPLHVFEWLPAMRRAGFRRAALYVVRPDGYVGLAAADAAVDRLRRYFAERRLRPRQIRT